MDHLSSNLVGADHVSDGLMEDVFKVWRRKVRTSEKSGITRRKTQRNVLKWKPGLEPLAVSKILQPQCVSAVLTPASRVGPQRFRSSEGLRLFSYWIFSLHQRFSEARKSLF